MARHMLFFRSSHKANGVVTGKTTKGNIRSLLTNRDVNEIGLE
jgi:hypothetical protein